MILGAGKVGKTSITIRMVGDIFKEVYDIKSDEGYTCDMIVRGKNVRMDILDTTAHEHFGMNRHFWPREAQNFVLIYDIRSEVTFKIVQQVYKTICRIKEGQAFNIVLVGNKCDLYNECDKIQARMELTRQNIKDLVYGYLRNREKELDNSNVTIIPDELQKICLRYHNEIPPEHIEVTYEMGEELARSWENQYFKIPFLETSAKTGENVEKIFANIIMLCQDATSFDYT